MVKYYHPHHLNGDCSENDEPVSLNHDHYMKACHVGIEDHCTRDIDYDTTCGIGPLRPSFCRGFARIETFVGVFSACAMVTQFLTNYLSSQITTIEKQFGLNSAQSGFLLSCNDIGFLLTSLLASYAAHRVHIPRSLAIMVVVYGLAALVCSASYFSSKDMFIEHRKLFTASSDIVGQTGDTEITLQWQNVSYNTSGTLYNGQTVNMSHSVTHQIQLCIDQLALSDNVTTDTNDCSETDESKAGQFGIGVPNQYTTIGLTLLAIGRCHI